MRACPAGLPVKAHALVGSASFLHPASAVAPRGHTGCGEAEAMVDYARHTCAGEGCGKILEQPHMTKVVRRVEIARRRGGSFRTNNRGLRSYGANQSNYSRLETFWYCAECNAARIAEIRAMVFGSLVLLAVLAIGIAIWSAMRTPALPDISASSADVAAASPSPPTEAMPSAAFVDANKTDVGADPENIQDDPQLLRTQTDTRDAREMPAAAQAPSQGGDAPSLVDTIAGAPRSDAKVAAAIDEAFTSGSPARWKSGHLKGYAVPSEPSSVGCRTIQVSIDRTDVAIPPMTVCPQ
jgi:hypothetical protein